MVGCAGTKGDGTPCAVTVEPPQTRCWWHAPENAERRRRAASKGGKAKASPLARELHALLEDLTARVVSGTLPTARGAVAAQLVNTRIRLLEVERKRMEDQELVERIEELEETRRGGAAWGA